MAAAQDDRGPPAAGTDYIRKWYTQTRPLWIDLVGDYAGKELFLVEGDSLLRECFEDGRLDFDGGFQLLHAVYVVERFLENLTKRHCQFHIGFFEENAELCIPDGQRTIRRSRYLLAREVIKNHLTAHLPSSHPTVEVHTFPSLESQEFKDYRNHCAVQFVMTHDGAAKTATRDPVPGDEKAKTLLRGMIWWFNVNKLNVALINRTEFQDSKIFTMIVESFTLPTKLLLPITKQFVPRIVQTRLELIELQQGESDEPEVPGSDLDLEKLSASIDERESSESFYLSAYVISDLLKQKSCNVFMASAFLLHTIVLRRVPLSQRRLPLITFDAGFENSLSNFLAIFSGAAQSVLKDEEWAELLESREIACDTMDLVDGRVFRAVIQALSNGSIQDAIPQAGQNDWESLSRLVKKLSNEDLSLEGSDDIKSSETTATKEDFESTSVDSAVLPFSNPVFDKHLECIHVTTDTSVSARMGRMKIYRETSHWHNHRKPLNPKQAPAQKVSKWRNPLRTNQFYMKEMTAYAASLTGAKGKALEPETITVGPKKLVKLVEEKPAKPEKPESSKPKSKKDEAQESKSSGPAKKGSKKAAAGLSKKDQIVADNQQKKSGTETDKVFAAWATVLKSNLEVVADDQDRYLKTVAYLNGLDSTKTNYLEGDINIYILQSLIGWWARYCKADKKPAGYHVVALIWTTIRTICASRSLISKDVIRHVTKVSTWVGIPDALSPLTPSGADRKLSFTFKEPANPQSLKIEISQTALQLDFCGPYMDRMLDAKPDPRVSNFVPDGWQRDVLDQLDANKSVFVVAPTSAGKTFISFYAMEQILRADNDGVLVYVAPTKALVNQIAAEVQGRFSKKYPQAGKGIWAIHTRDYRVNNSTGCQILVTVPHVLQIMLLSPTNAKSWATRVKRIIFDEIHSIGQAEDGVVWEQLLLLAPCPIIALSATVGNPDQFNDWLTETQKSAGSELKMIQHSTRYSDLRKYTYEPPKSFRFSGLGRSYGVGLGLDGLPGFEPVHPVASLVDKTRGMPDDLALEPRDCFSLWKAMIKFETDEYKVPGSLNPTKALPPCVKKADIFAWEKGLKEVLRQWIADDDSPFDKVVAALTPSETAPYSGTLSPSQLAFTDEDAVDPLSLKATTLPLLLQLHKRRALPAILFNYDRTGCEIIASTLLSQLVKAEATWKEGPGWKKHIDGYEKWKIIQEKKSTRKAKPSKKTKDDDDEGGSKTDRMRDEASEGASIYDLFDPEAPQAEFSFANPKKLQQAELDGFVYQLRKKYIREDLIDLLKRGIGVHHAGMNRKYRQCVEMLFRKGFLRVVIATGTLSLGINMPCATVVFSGDSVFLTALNFRQAAGRSGRRGFDLLGNVVFQGISFERVKRLLSSRLPELTGHFPITTTLVLRLFTLLNDSKNSPYAIKAINALLSHPRLYLGGQSFKEQVLHHLRFSIEYLRKNDLLGPGGEPVNFTSCVSHLYFTENSSFAFHALLKGGYFHTLCADIDQSTDMVLQKMMLVLSHLFGRRVCREADDEEEAENIKRSQSIVYLPPMPEQAAQIIRDHNQATLDIFATYAKTFVAQHIKKEESVLPFTETPVSQLSRGIDEKSVNGHVNGEVHENHKSSVMGFLPSLTAPHARSAFFALSGLGDNFTTIEDLCSSTREGVFLESAAIPHLELHPDETKSPLNAYLLDFYMHGSIDPLEKANGIRKSDVWFVLNDFSLVLATIVTSIALHLGLGADTDAEMLDVMGSGDAAENEGDEEMAATSDTSPAPSVKSVATQQAAPVRKGKKVVDDWDAGEDALVEEENFLQNESEKGTGATDDEEYDKLMNVYKAFRKLKTEFDAKFRLIWA